ncbi:class F sortase [Streptomyces peucetius]|uniref:Class F sortase n=1 Tax=Streptomyces peucetius TaxID=1950 RepID=A0ABY6I4L7_STRPE|nr:class F sortase [Streptomyces peucetius]UYQ60827.1 class F sortase [Streptomyces peucetius]
MTVRSPNASGSSWITGVPRRVVPWLLGLLALAVLALTLVNTLAEPASAPGKAGDGPRPTAPAPVAGPADASKPSKPSAPPDPALPRSAPTRLVIPQIGVDAPFTDLAIGPSGALDAPPADDVNLVGWFAAGVSPGERGTSIIAGHVDTVTSPAVFAELSELEPGHRFHVRRKDGTTATFVVDSLESFHKGAFPNERVYADTPDAQVRLITCSGSYDRKAKDYTENLVVFAHLVAPK